ncbi:Uncharacterised protein [Campylobacter insulaenigrae]|uniref:hypothetical protein n=1 Tax=Campylobacter insulaenigrae TaxID=260714 RepID=UPI000F6CF85F|nr:hypothetical protein [Campylobacter insulaenigrae]MCR6574335.1 hypothetical protein [Campylobacter insulaenigrae]MCR6590532.1 hypothetical protein [Campylobacter insulaenigrae]MCR6592069.1 hypothetical protein [Campylobacter insulaenigrae]VEJ53383.1 Uncharacterised protein [Campylobacter insulaenigrae]
MKKLKEKINVEFWDYVALMTIFFISMIVLAFLKLVLPALFCLFLASLIAILYPLKWIVQIIIVKIKKG